MKLLVCLLLVTWFILTPKLTWAHQLKADGSIGAIVHIDPQDDPIVGEQATFYFAIKDTEGKFRPESCTCTGRILQNGQELFSADLFITGDNQVTSPQFNFTFPEKGVYTIHVEGHPKEGSFQPFTLNYDLRVDRISAISNSWSTLIAKKHMIHYIGLAIITFFLIALIIIDRRRIKNVKS